MTTYEAESIPHWKLKDGISGLPKDVSFFGALPQPLEAYEQVSRPSIKVNNNGRITYSNYFFGEIIKTEERAEQFAARLNARLAV